MLSKHNKCKLFFIFSMQREMIEFLIPPQGIGRAINTHRVILILDLADGCTEISNF
jgi:hypothetical protein